MLHFLFRLFVVMLSKIISSYILRLPLFKQTTTNDCLIRWFCMDRWFSMNYIKPFEVHCHLHLYPYKEKTKSLIKRNLLFSLSFNKKDILNKSNNVCLDVCFFPAPHKNIHTWKTMPQNSTRSSGC